jgi:hypothetical protein
MDGEDKTARYRELAKRGACYIALGEKHFNGAWGENHRSNAGCVIAEEREVSRGSGSWNAKDALSNGYIFMSVG